MGSDERLAYEEAIQVVEEVIEPACASVGLDPVRADGLSRAGEITEQVFRRLRDDDVVIADLTGANANVMYELGLRHTRNKLTVQVGEYGRLPFDINVIRTVQFSRSPNGLVNARKELEAILAAGVLGEYDEVTSTRIWNEDASVEEVLGAGIESTEGEEGGDDPGDDAPGFLDLLVGAEEGQERVVAAAQAISGAIEAMGTLAEQGSEKIEASDAAGRGMKGRLALAVDFAAGLDGVAGSLESAVDEYASAMADVSAGNLAIIEKLEDDPSQIEAAMEWALLTRRLAQTARGSVAELASFAEIMRENAKLSRVLRGPTNRVLSSLDKFGSSTAVADEWDRRLQALGVPIPSEDWEPSADEGELGNGDAEDPAAG